MNWVFVRLYTNYKMITMKSFFIAVITLVSVFQLSGQRSPEGIFRKYSHNPNYTTLFINGGLMKLINHFDEENSLEAISTIRIVAQNNDSWENNSFYDDIVGSLDFRGYEELIRVHEYQNNVLVLSKDDGDYIYELLVIVGGEDNAFIQINGKLSLEQAERISTNINVGTLVSMN